MKKYLVAFVVVVCSIWTIFVGIDLLGLNHKDDFTKYFGEEDSEILVIHNQKEVDWQRENFGVLPTNQSLVISLFPRLKNVSVYISTKRPLVVIKQRENWDSESIDKLFKNGLFKYDKGQFKTFKFGDYQGKYTLNTLVLYKGELIEHKVFPEVDKKASYSIVRFLQEEIVVDDIYQKVDKTYRYTSRIGAFKFKNLMDDASLFSSLIPTNFSSYTYYSNEFAKQKDSTYKSGYLHPLNEVGFVLLSDGKDSLVVFPFKEEASPIQVINEKKGLPELNQKQAKFNELALFDFMKVGVDGRRIFVLEIDNVALFSTSQIYLEAIATEMKLHKSMSQNQEKMKLVFGSLPKRVLYRQVDSKVQKTLATIGKKLVQTDLKQKDVYIAPKQEKINDYFAMNPGERIMSFSVSTGRGNVILSTESNRLIGYVNGALKWEKKYSQPIVNMGVFNAENNLTCLIVEGEAQVYDPNGRILYRFAVNHNLLPLQHFAPDGKEYFPVTTSPNSLIVFTSKGGIYKQIKPKLEIKESFLFKFQGRDFVGVRTKNQLLYTDFVKKSKVLESVVDSLSKTILLTDGPAFYKMDENGVQLQKLGGQKLSLKLKNAQNIVVSREGNNDVLWVEAGTVLAKFDATGRKKWEKKLELSEISNIQVFQNSNGKVVIGILDGLQNRIYLFDLNGVAIDADNRHGERAFQLSAFGTNAFSITTFLGTNLIQYNKL